MEFSILNGLENYIQYRIYTTMFYFFKIKLSIKNRALYSLIFISIGNNM